MRTARLSVGIVATTALSMALLSIPTEVDGQAATESPLVQQAIDASKRRERLLDEAKVSYLQATKHKSEDWMVCFETADVIFNWPAEKWIKRDTRCPSAESSIRITSESSSPPQDAWDILTSVPPQSVFVFDGGRTLEMHPDQPPRAWQGGIIPGLDTFIRAGVFQCGLMSDQRWYSEGLRTWRSVLEFQTNATLSDAQVVFVQEDPAFDWLLVRRVTLRPEWGYLPSRHIVSRIDRSNRETVLHTISTAGDKNTLTPMEALIQENEVLAVTTFEGTAMPQHVRCSAPINGSGMTYGWFKYSRVEHDAADITSVTPLVLPPETRAGRVIVADNFTHSVRKFLNGVPVVNFPGEGAPTKTPTSRPLGVAMIIGLLAIGGGLLIFVRSRVVGPGRHEVDREEDVRGER